MKKDPKKLREQARKLIEEAERVEEEKARRIGQAVMKLHGRNWEGFDPVEFRRSVEAIIGSPTESDGLPRTPGKGGIGSPTDSHGVPRSPSDSVEV